MNSLVKIIVISAGAFVAVIALVLFLARPIIGQIGILHQQEGTQQAELDQLSAQIVAYNQAKAQLKEVNYKDVIDNTIVIREDLAVVLVEVEAKAAQTNVIESISIVDDLASGGREKVKLLVPNEKNITEVPYTLNFTGTFTDTLNFMQYLEHLSHFTELSRISFNATSEQSSGTLAAHSKTISGTISGVFFIKKK